MSPQRLLAWAHTMDTAQEMSAEDIMARLSLVRNFCYLVLPGAT